MKFAGSVVPVIDLTKARTGSEAEKQQVADEVGAAARSIGFLVVSGHGVPQPVIDAATEASRRLFDLPAADKAKYRSPDPAIYRGYFGIETGNLASTIGEDGAKPDHREYYNVGRSISTQRTPISPRQPRGVSSRRTSGQMPMCPRSSRRSSTITARWPA